MPILTEQFIDAIATASEENGKLNIIEEYIKENPTSLNRTLEWVKNPLGVAANARNLESTSKLLELGADINGIAFNMPYEPLTLLQSLSSIPDLSGDTFWSFVNLLFKNEQKIDPTTFPLFLSQLKAEDVSRALENVNINSLDKSGNSALHLDIILLEAFIQRLDALRQPIGNFDDHIEHIKALLAADIKINHQNNDGDTALHVFFKGRHCANQSSEVLKPILDLFFSNPRLDLTLRNNDGQTVADLAPKQHQALYQRLSKVNAMYEERAHNKGSLFAYTPKDILDETARFALDTRTDFSRMDANNAESNTSKDDPDTQSPRQGK